MPEHHAPGALLPEHPPQSPGHEAGRQGQGRCRGDPPGADAPRPAHRQPLAQRLHHAAQRPPVSNERVIAPGLRQGPRGDRLLEVVDGEPAGHVGLTLNAQARAAQQ